MDKTAFQRLKLEEKYEAVKIQGEFIGSRIIPSYRVHLFALKGFYVEMFIHSELNKIQWIEIQENQDILNEYIQDLDWRKGLNL